MDNLGRMNKSEVLKPDEITGFEITINGVFEREV